MEYSKIIYTEDEIIGYALDITPLLRKEIHDVMDRYFRSEIDKDELDIGLNYYLDLIKDLEDTKYGYGLVRIQEHPMGGYTIERLED